MKQTFGMFLMLTALTINTANGDEAENLRKSIRDMTHVLVSKDSTFLTSIQGILPEGVKRMSAEEFASVKIPMTTTAKPELSAESFVEGKVGTQEIIKTLGEPAYRSKEKDGSSTFSYDAANGAIATYFFNKNDVLERSYGYSVPK